MSARKKIRRRERIDPPLLDFFFGVRRARRLRLATLLAIAALIVGGCVVFLFESQTFGRLALAVGAAWGLFWVGMRHLRRTAESPLDRVRGERPVLIASAIALTVAAWVVFFAVWEELGLLLALFAAVPLLLIVADVRRDPMASPMDGPPFGETGPSS